MFLSEGHEPLEGHKSIQKGHEILDSRKQQQLSSSREAKWESGCKYWLSVLAIARESLIT